MAAGVLIVLAIPVGSLNIGFNAGADSLPDDVASKRTLQLLEEHFTSSLTQPALIAIDAADVRSPQVQRAVDALMARLEEEDAFFPPFETNVSRNGDLMSIRVPLAGKIDDDQSEAGVKLLRDVVIPESFAGSGAQVYVAGQTAEGIDFRNRMYDSAVYVFAFVLGLAFLLLLVMFRSIVIPVKAIILNLLSVAAAYGILVMVFQQGWGIGILSSEASGVIEAWLPLFLFGILFGLSMDYHMLLLSRIKEAHDQGHSNEESVSMGIRVTAGQITSAAAIMVGVFSTFATSRILGLQQFGLGLGVAVLIDATLIRVVLLPATMKLLGDWNWYLPSWLEWLPSVSSEGHAVAGPEGSPTPRPAAPSLSAAYDYEYERNGVSSLFMLFAPLDGWRRVEVRERRTKVDWAHVIKKLVDEDYPDRDRIVLVMDNLNTHKLSSLYEAFEPAEARRIAERLEIHYTPKHGSWLNMAEIEIGVLARQCLDRRIANQDILRGEVNAGGRFLVRRKLVADGSAGGHALEGPTTSKAWRARSLTSSGGGAGWSGPPGNGNAPARSAAATHLQPSFSVGAGAARRQK